MRLPAFHIDHPGPSSWTIPDLSKVKGMRSGDCESDLFRSKERKGFFVVPSPFQSSKNGRMPHPYQALQRTDYVAPARVTYLLTA